MNEDSLKKRYVIKLISSIFNAIINAFFLAIIPKALGPIAYGQFVYLQNFFQQLYSFLDMGTSTAFFTKLSARRNRKELILFYILYLTLVLLLVIGFVYFIDLFGYITYFLPDISAKYVYMGIFLGYFLWTTQLYIKISDAYAITVSVELTKIANKTATLFLLLYFVYFTLFDLSSCFYFYYISLVSLLVMLTLLFMKKGIFSNLQVSTLRNQFLKLIKEFVEYCHPLVVYSVVGLLAGLFDMWILQSTSGSKQTGFYGLAYSLASMCFLFTSSMTPIITREFAKVYEEKNLEHMRKLFYRYIPMLYSVSAYFAIFISIQSEHVLKIFTDDKYNDAYLVLVIMALYPIHQTYGQLSGSVFYSTGQTKLLRNISLWVQPFGIVISFIFIYFLNLGAVGLAYKMILVQLISVNVQLYLNTKFLNLNFKHFIYHQFYSFLFFGVLGIISSTMINLSSTITEFIISGFVYTLLVMIFSYIFPQIFSTTRDEIKRNLKKVIDHVTKKET